jgi:hypothetical protein
MPTATTPHLTNSGGPLVVSAGAFPLTARGASPAASASASVAAAAAAAATLAAFDGAGTRTSSRASSFSSVDGSGGAALRGGRPAADDTMPLDSRRPDWNAEQSTLMMRFMGGRVAAASSKNFLVDLRAADAPAALLADAAAAAAACGAPPPTRVPVLQFGKLRHGRWSVDLRHPMSVLQAFAIFLSAFHWLPLLDTSGEDEG